MIMAHITLDYSLTIDKRENETSTRYNDKIWKIYDMFTDISHIFSQPLEIYPTIVNIMINKINFTTNQPSSYKRYLK